MDKFKIQIGQWQEVVYSQKPMKSMLRHSLLFEAVVSNWNPISFPSEKNHDIQYSCIQFQTLLDHHYKAKGIQTLPCP